ncbi:Protein of unknown function [Halovenus aranensis]|uniref:DUF3179 domain-containing protein n=1 Tax=Halovenus aranensis TaxID=890420 RepID=A0A1G8X0K0_9EURY|nr:DUF3179 domain-containing protein [Halovenus aranensis]SDJ83991.1 Protein of unknown function [Halovenus aranensis]
MNVVDVLEKDAIPSIDDPVFGEKFVGGADDEVLVLDGDPPKAYPIRILNFHEIVNDRIDGDPVAVTWCPLCASGVVYERTVGERVLTFGVSGKLADDDLVMYDRETDSEWKQSRGECLSGTFEGTELAVRPAGIITWERFCVEYPDGVVLQPPDIKSEAASDDDQPAPVDYTDDPYEEYFEIDEFGLKAHRTGEGRSWDREDVSPKTLVLGIEHGGESVGYPEPRLRAEGGVVTDTVGDMDVVVTAADGLHAFEDPGYDFAVVDGRLGADGTTWDPATGVAADGRQLERAPARRLFAFTWQDDHGPAAFY